MRQATLRKTVQEEKMMSASPVFHVVHPLDDVAEQKRDPASLGQIKLTPSVMTSLLILRSYLILMMLLVGYQFLDLAGILHIGR